MHDSAFCNYKLRIGSNSLFAFADWFCSRNTHPNTVPVRQVCHLCAQPSIRGQSQTQTICLAAALCIFPNLCLPPKETTEPLSVQESWTEGKQASCFAGNSFCCGNSEKKTAGSHCFLHQWAPVETSLKFCTSFSQGYCFHTDDARKTFRITVWSSDTKGLK